MKKSNFYKIIFSPILCLLLLALTTTGFAQKGSIPNAKGRSKGKSGGAGTSAHSVSVEVSTFAGSGLPGSNDGKDTSASFDGPSGIVADKNGNLYVADGRNHKIRKITPDGLVTTLAGNGMQGSADGIGTAASFNGPAELTIDPLGNLFVTDRGNDKVRKITPEGLVTTFAGSGIKGKQDGSANQASFSWPCGITIDTSGNLYIADYVNYQIRKITPAGEVTTFATNTPTNPSDLAFDAAGNLYMTELNNNKILKISPAGVVAVFAGSYKRGVTDDTAAKATFYLPLGIAVDPSGNVYVTEQGNHTIRRISKDGVVTTIAGNGSPGSKDGTGTTASFNLPVSICIDAAGNLYVADQENNKIRKITFGKSPAVMSQKK